jgi:glycosyltransferase involved in cell wall biosynthesis
MRISILGDINSSHTQKWISAYLSKKIEVQCISINDPDISFEHKNFTFQSLGIEKVKNNTGSTFSKWSYLLKVITVRKALKSFKPDHIHAHFASSYGMLALMSNQPYYVSLWGSDILNFPHKNPLFKLILGLILKRSLKVFSTSNYMAKECFSLYKINPIVIPFGIEIERFIPKEYPSTENPLIIIGTIKALEQTYGMDLLIKAFALATKESTAPLKLLIVGAGSLMSEFQLLVKKLGIVNQVEFKGKIAHELVPKTLVKMDVFVNLSRQESFGVSVIEASASGLPVIVSNIEGLKEVYIENETAISVDINKLEEIKEKIILLGESIQTRKSMGQKGRQFVIENFNWTHCVEKQISSYTN